MGKGGGKCGSVVDEKDLDEVDTKKLVAAKGTGSSNNSPNGGVHGNGQRGSGNDGHTPDQSPVAGQKNFSNTNGHGGANGTTNGSGHLTQSQSTASGGQIALTTITSPSQTKSTLSLHDKTGKGAGASTPKIVDPEVAVYLSNVPLLAKLSFDERALLASSLEEKRFGHGVRIVVEGEVGHEFFIIKDGQAIVTRINPETKEENELCELKRGDYFGETALLTNANRGATITAAGECICLTLGRKQFNALFGEDRLNITFAKRAAISAEGGFNPDKKSDNDSKELPPAGDRTKTSEQRRKILTVVEGNILFQNLDRDQQGQVVDTMWTKEIKKGTTIIKQGTLGDVFYVVESGSFDIFVSREGKEPIRVATRGPGTSFGELALMYNAPRAATVTATVDSIVWLVDRWTFRRILTNVENAKYKEYETFLKHVESFGVLLDYERSKIAESLEEVSFPAGHDIVKQGDEADAFFILKKGEVIATKTTPGIAEKQEVKRYRAGDYFGERALITGEVRAATCTTLMPCECLYLNKAAFISMLGPMDEIFRKRVAGYNNLESPRGGGDEKKRFIVGGTRSSTMGSDVPGSPTNFSKRISMEPEENYLNKDIRIADLTPIGILGKGSFGVVTLVRDTAGQTYALKQVSKTQIVTLGQQEHIMSEKRVMAALNHPFLVRLHATFNDKNCLYFLLEPSLGGELFSVLRAKTFFDEHTARFFAAGVILAFEYMHSKGIIYRDLKPENLLLDARGYLKITDFGFAKKVGDQRTWTLCGTPDYLAPEVVSGQGHGRGVDWWTLGILIYEMLASYPPFYDEDPMKTYAKIMHGQIAFPMHFSKQAVDLIRRLLHAKPTKRLGVLKGGARLVKDHLWFKGFDWDAFEAQRMPAPIVMPVKDNTDLSNFEEYPEEEMQPEEYIPDPKNPDWDHDF